MKKIFAIVITLAMLLSLGAVLASADAPVLPDSYNGATAAGNYAVADPSEFSALGTVKIQWDKDAATKLDLSDGDMADWAAAGYESITIDASNMVSWVGGAADAIDPGMPENWNITTYFVADSEWLYIGFYVTDPAFAYGSNPGAYDGDAFQICIDFGGKLGQVAMEDPDSLTNPKNIFYSFSCISDGAPIQIMRQESDQDGLISEENGDGVKGAAKKTDAGWSAEFALSFKQMFDDFEWKIWEEDKKLYVGGENNDPLKIGCCLYYLDRSETAGNINWAAGTSNGVVDSNGAPIVTWSAYDNGINLELDITEDVTFAYDEKIIILPSGETAPPEEDKDEETDPVEDEETDAPTAAPTDEATDAPTEAPTQGGDDAADEGCASIVGFGAAAVLAAAAAAFVLKKKD